MKILFYSLPAFAFAIPTFPVMVFLPALYSEEFGLDIAKIGLTLFFAKIIDIISDPLMGWINDNQLEKIGHELKKSSYGSYLLRLLEKN